MCVCSSKDIHKNVQGFPGGPMVKNPPRNARDTGFDPWSRKIPHAAGPLSLCATTNAPVLESLRATTPEASVP